MSSCADVFIELLSTKNKLLSADTWMMNLSVLVSKNADQPWDVELTDDRRRRFKKRNIAEKVNGTCKQVVNTYVWRIAATKPWVHRTDNLNIGPCMDISATL
ncbi:hypothetical protein DPMN_178645 [Dreissena polymorpha]|uniref:Transposase n=1 Tax=Dreissena polymorpha TaxID=45954 RepID=A0A9D4EBD1_DREPO|nr:hypothetical protein DPMN_178645 [Dreissena polymorpha]